MASLRWMSVYCVLVGCTAGCGPERADRTTVADAGDDDSSASEGASTESSSSGESPMPELIECGDTTCEGDLLCKIPPLGCNYEPCERGEVAEWTRQGPFECVESPARCGAPESPDYGRCVETELCSTGSSPIYDNHTIQCDEGAADCFC